MLKAVQLLSEESMAPATIRQYAIFELDTDLHIMTGKIVKEVELPIDDDIVGENKSIKAQQTIALIDPTPCDPCAFLDSAGEANKEGKLLVIVLEEEALEI